MVDKEQLKENLRKRLLEAKREREMTSVHAKTCRCGGHGNIPMAQFSIGYVKCSG